MIATTVSSLNSTDSGGANDSKYHGGFRPFLVHAAKDIKSMLRIESFAVVDLFG